MATRGNKNAVVVASARKRAGEFRAIAAEVQAEAHSRRDRELWRAARQIYAMAATEDRRVAKLVRANEEGPAATPAPAPADPQSKAKQDLMRAIKEDRLDDAAAALARYRRAKARAHSAASSPDYGGGLEAPAPEPVPQMQVAPPVPATDPHPVLSSARVAEVKAAIAKIRAEHPDVARRLQSVLRIR